ncbi:MucR family transcriptional regulator [Bosea sp. RAC05]|uniref:MucR family transcriptional regulator n=1 Tax=Bosea sp. RAC05 TaxID=1842539 RepID=UPI00083CE39E|nr:MucR family transcriptional regulator [Bosea sp. RAC05]AOG02771.1 ROS/MUCR transcriptional regulator family protein [Bosea sp. RAC05]
MNEHLADLTATIVAAFVSNNSVQAQDLPGLIENTYGVLSRVTEAKIEPEVAEQIPAVSIKKSITPDYLICLEDGKKFKSLKRHLKTSYNLTPEDYRRKWKLPADYPMVAPSYAEARSSLAKQMGLGRKAAVAAKPKGRSNGKANGAAARH